MKKFRLLSLVMCISLLCMALTGCVGTVTTTEINADGSGSFVFKAGYTQEGLEMLNSMAGEEGTPIDISTLVPFDYNGTTYYGAASQTIYFDSCDDFNKKLMETLNSTDGVSMREGTCILSKLDDGSISLKFGGDVDLSTEDMSSMASTPEEKQAMEEMMKDFIMAFEFKFPYPVTQTSSENFNGVVVNGNSVSLDLVKMSIDCQERGISNAVVEFISKNTAGGTVNDYPSQGQHTIVPTSPFSDVITTDWFYSAVKKMADIGMVAGVGDNKFNPNGQMTYAEFATIVARANKMELGSINGYWAGKALEYARDWTYIKDLGDIIPANYDVPVPREVAVAGVYRMSRQFLQNKDTSITELDIPDYYSIDESYRNDILFAYQSGLSHGSDSKGTFNPKATLTRAELCQLLYNANFELK